MVAAFLPFHCFSFSVAELFSRFHNFTRKNSFLTFFSSRNLLEKFHLRSARKLFTLSREKKFIFFASFEIRLFAETILSNQQKVLKFRIACCSDGFVVAAAAVLLPFSLSVELCFFINFSFSQRAWSSSNRARCAQERAKKIFNKYLGRNSSELFFIQFSPKSGSRRGEPATMSWGSVEASCTRRARLLAAECSVEMCKQWFICLPQAQVVILAILKHQLRSS